MGRDLAYTRDSRLVIRASPTVCRMDSARSDLIAAAHSLLRLAIRVQAMLSSASSWQGRIFRVRDLSPPSEWLDAVDPANSISGVPIRAVEASEQLLVLVRADQPIDPRHAAFVMQTVAGDAIYFSGPVRRFAARYGIHLADRVADEPGAFGAMQDVMRASNRNKGEW